MALKIRKEREKMVGGEMLREGCSEGFVLGLLLRGAKEGRFPFEIEESTALWCWKNPVKRKGM